MRHKDPVRVSVYSSFQSQASALEPGPAQFLLRETQGGPEPDSPDSATQLTQVRH